MHLIFYVQFFLCFLGLSGIHLMAGDNGLVTMDLLKKAKATTWKKLNDLTSDVSFYEYLDPNAQASLAFGCSQVLQNNKSPIHESFWKFLHNFIKQMPDNKRHKGLKFGLLDGVIGYAHREPLALSIVSTQKGYLNKSHFLGLLKKIGEDSTDDYVAQQKGQINEILKYLKSKGVLDETFGRLLLNLKKGIPQEILEQLFKMDQQKISYNPYEFKEFLCAIESNKIDSVLISSENPLALCIAAKLQEIRYINSKSLKDMKGLWNYLMNVRNLLDISTRTEITSWVEKSLQESYAKLLRVYSVDNTHIALTIARTMEDTTTEISEILFYLLSDKALKDIKNTLSYFNRLVKLSDQDNCYAFMALAYLIRSNPKWISEVFESGQTVKLGNLKLNSKNFEYPGRCIDFMMIPEKWLGGKKITTSQENLKNDFNIWISKNKKKETILDVEKNFSFWKALHYYACNEYKEALDSMREVLSNYQKTKNDVNALIVQAYIKIFECELKNKDCEGLLFTSNTSTYKGLDDLLRQLTIACKPNKDGRQFWLSRLKHQLGYYLPSKCTSDALVEMNAYLSNLYDLENSTDSEVLNPYYLEKLEHNLIHQLHTKEKVLSKKLLNRVHTIFKKILNNPETSSTIKKQVHYFYRYVFSHCVLDTTFYKEEVCGEPFNKIKYLKRSIEHYQASLEYPEDYCELAKIYLYLAFETKKKEDVSNSYKTLQEIFTHNKDAQMISEILEPLQKYFQLFLEYKTILSTIDFKQHGLYLKCTLARLRDFLNTDQFSCKVRHAIQEILFAYASYITEDEMLQSLQEVFKEYPGYAEFFLGGLTYTTIINDSSNQPVKHIVKHQYSKGPLFYYGEAAKKGFLRALIRIKIHNFQFNIQDSFLDLDIDNLLAQATSPSVKVFNSLIELSKKHKEKMPLTDEDVTDLLIHFKELFYQASSTKLSISELENVDEIQLGDKFKFIYKTNTIHEQNREAIRLSDLYLRFLVLDENDIQREKVLNDIRTCIKEMNKNFDKNVVNAEVVSLISLIMDYTCQ